MTELYATDSFFTLGLPAQVGLVFLSLCLAGGWLWATWHMTRGHHVLVRLGIGLFMFAAFEWLSPQVYYAYYMVLMDLMPRMVIGWPPLLDDLGRLLTFNDRANLSFHARGLLGWALLIVSIYPTSRK